MSTAVGGGPQTGDRRGRPAKRGGGAVYEQPEFLSADSEIARFAEQYLTLRGTTPRTREAYQRDLEHYGSFLKARAAGVDPATKQRPPYEQLSAATYADILAYQTYLARSRKYAPRSMRRKIATLRT
ncbi:MAG: phage integrase N-terminal SAM-like domain-containing protein, partial [Candidatus Eremiobacteraeota bacterium]|nr:phage integrase N-terminal SAM-like domain-containing protein [Candidatus Eremiobacteraeota bacterium]